MTLAIVSHRTIRRTSCDDREDLGVARVSPADLELQPGTVVQPDVFVVPPASRASRDQVRDWGVVTSLLVAVEVISTSSARTDRLEKRDYYLSTNVPEYWVVDLDARVVERWSPGRETPTVLRDALEWRAARASEPLTVDLTELFERVWRKFRQIGGA
jgi:Uma2 family endonuclease